MVLHSTIFNCINIISGDEVLVFACKLSKLDFMELKEIVRAELINNGFLT